MSTDTENREAFRGSGNQDAAAFDYFRGVEGRLSSLETSSKGLGEDLKRLESGVSTGLAALGEQIRGQRLGVFQVWGPLVATLSLILMIGAYVVDGIKANELALERRLERVEERLWQQSSN